MNHGKKILRTACAAILTITLSFAGFAGAGSSAYAGERSSSTSRLRAGGRSPLAARFLTEEESTLQVEVPEPAEEGTAPIDTPVNPDLETRYDDQLWIADEPVPDLELSELPVIEEEKHTRKARIIDDRPENTWGIGRVGDGRSIYSLDEETVYQGSPYSVKIENTTYNSASVKKSFAVKPDTDYIFTARVKYRDYEPDPSAGARESGAWIGWDNGRFRSLCTASEDWEQISCAFRTKDETSCTLALMNGMYNAGCKGTAWFTDLRLEEASAYSEHWNILTVIFKNLDATGERDGEQYSYQASFNREDMAYLAGHVKLLEELLPEMSGDLLRVDHVDVVSTAVPVRSLIPYDYDDAWGSHVHAWQPAMTYDNVYREINRIMEHTDRVYNQVILILPGYGIMGWLGLANGDFRGANVCKLVDYTGTRALGANTVSECSLADVHEICHNLEADTRALGTDLVPLHSRSEHGYADGRDGEYAWYTDYLRGEIRDGSQGIDPSVFTVPNAYEVIFEDMQADPSLTLPSGEVTWEAVEPAPEPAVSWRIGPEGDYATLGLAIKAITREVKAGTAEDSYALTFGDEITEKNAITLPKGDLTISIIGGTLNLNAPTITANCDLVIGCRIASASGKKPLIRVGAEKTLTINRDQQDLGTLRGMRTSGLILNADVSARRVRGFASTDTTDGTLTVGGTVTGNLSEQRASQNRKGDV